MNEKVDFYKKDVSERENELLENYKNLIVNYEDTRQLYEKTIKEYENSIADTEYIQCSSIVTYNFDPIIIKWQVVTLDGEEIYIGPNSLQYETWTFNLEDLNLETGTLFLLKVVVSGKDDRFSTEILQYEPASATVYYEYTKDNENYVLFDGVVPSVESPPILKCSKIAAKHTSYTVLMRFKIVDAVTGEVLDGSVRTPKEGTWNYSLVNLGRPAGTLLKLRAAVTGGTDSIAYMLIEYDPTSTDTANFGFYGNAFKTIVPYKG